MTEGAGVRHLQFQMTEEVVVLPLLFQSEMLVDRSIQRRVILKIIQTTDEVGMDFLLSWTSTSIVHQNGELGEKFLLGKRDSPQKTVLDVKSPDMHQKTLGGKNPDTLLRLRSTTEMSAEFLTIRVRLIMRYL